MFKEFSPGYYNIICDGCAQTMTTEYNLAWSNDMERIRHHKCFIWYIDADDFIHYCPDCYEVKDNKVWILPKNHLQE